MSRRPIFRPRSLDLWKRYTRADAGADLGAGFTVALIALPLALALGVASIPAGTATPFPAPALGIFTAIIAGFLISLLGGSKVQIGGPTAAFIPIILLIVQKHGYDGLILATLMAGVILVLMGLARLGTLIKFIPYPVTSGFTTGIAIAILIGQMPDLLGIPGVAPGEPLHRVPWIVQHLPDLHWPSAVLGVAAVALILVWNQRGWRRLPAAFVAIVVATVVVALASAAGLGGVSTIGSRFGADAIPSSLPPFVWPEISLERIRDLIGPATAIALLGAIESLLSAVVADSMIDDRHDANTELIAQGIANLVCPLFGGLPATGAIARTSANVRGGARTPVAGMVHAGTLLVIILVFAALARHVPLAAIAAVLVTVALRMGEWHELRRLARMPRGDALVLVTTCGLTVIFDLVIAIEVGMVLAAVLFIQRVADTTEFSLVTAGDELEIPEQVAQGKVIPEGVIVYRIFGPFFFGAAEKMEDAMQRIGRLPRVLILRLQLVPAIDATALNVLESVHERMVRSGGTVILSGVHRQPLEVMRRSGFIEKIGRANLRPHFDAALIRANEVLAEKEER